MNKIITVTLNTSIDNILVIKDFRKGKVIRASKSFIFASGKGINSARTIEALSHPVYVLGFTGKHYYDFFESIKSKFISPDFIKVDGETRINSTILDVTPKFISHIQSLGYSLNNSLLKELEKKIKSIARKNDVIVFSGSLPKGISNDSYYRLILFCKRLGTKVIFDSSQPYLEHGIKAVPFLIKPNLEELAQLYGTSVKKSETAIVKAARYLNSLGIEIVIVSLGAKGVIVTKRNSNSYYRGKLEINIKETSGDEIGCGDSMIGGIAVALANEFSLNKLITLGLACGAANIYDVGPGTCNYKDIVRLEKKVDLKTSVLK